MLTEPTHFNPLLGRNSAGALALSPSACLLDAPLRALALNINAPLNLNALLNLNAPLNLNALLLLRVCAH